MHVLFVHPNFPAQFRYLAPRLARDYGWRCTFATRNERAPDVRGVERVLYRLRSGASRANHLCTREFETTVGHAHGVYDALKARPDIQPDLTVAHSGFGSSLYLPHLYDAPIVNFFEYFHRPVGQTLGYRPDIPVTEAGLLRARTNNAMILLDLDNCDAGWCPNEAQRATFPREYRDNLRVIPEGVDTDLYGRRPDAARQLPGGGGAIDPNTRIVTYVSRGFELTRGFDVFMRAAKLIAEKFPDVLFLVVGTDRTHYGPDRRLTGGASLRERLLAGGEFDLSRFHFTGWVPEATLADVLSISDLHIYLTLPFITSWSMLDAMSCSCVVLASDQACTREYITHGCNGLLCDFFDVDGIANQAVDLLQNPAAYRALGEAARRTIEEKYSLEVCLPRLKSFFEEVAAKQRQPSVRAEVLVRCGAGFGPAAPSPSDAKQPANPHHKELPQFDGALPYFVERAATSNRSGEPLGEPGRGDEGPADAVRTNIASGNRNGKRITSRTVLFAWEDGGGLGHLMQMRPLVEDLAAAGHCIVMALRHLDRAVEVFGHAGVFYLQAPYRAPGPARFPRAVGYAQHLVNLGFGDDDGLFAHACAWRNLIRMVAPDLIVPDYAPTALLAARAFAARRATIGSGFCMPPDVDPPDGANGQRPAWAALRPVVAAAKPGPVRAAEDEVLQRVNWLLANWGEPPIDRLGQLFSDADEQFLTTWPELDHFRGCRGAGYWGPVLSSGGGESALWPDGQGKRVFVYLKNTPEAEDVLGVLKRAGCSTVAYVEGLSAAARKRVQAPHIAIAPRRLDVARVSRECDLAVTNGGHGVTAEMLLAGKPLMLVPLALEQQQTGQAVERLGAGPWAPAREPYTIVSKLQAMLDGGEDCAEAAQRFAKRYEAFDRDRQRRAMFERAEELLAAGERGAEPPRAQPQPLVG